MAATTEQGRGKGEGEDAAAAMPSEAPVRARRRRFGLLAKITTFLFLILVPLAALTWWISVQSLRANITAEFT